MSRKKVVKSAARKKPQSKQVTKAPATNLLKVEAEFFQAPAKFTEHLAKEVAALKQKENKLSTTITKIQAQINKLEKSLAAAKKVNTAAGRKQLAAAKKALNDTKKDYALSNAALKDTAKATADAELSLAKFQAIAKTLKAFEKDWAKQAKALKNKAKNKPVKRRRTAAKAAAPVLTVIEQPEFEATEAEVTANETETQFDDAQIANS